MSGDAGKGDTPRRVKIKQWDKNHDDINWNSKKKGRGEKPKPCPR